MEDDNGFRTWQAVADLRHHAGALSKVHFATLARASGLTPRAAGDALALLRDDGISFRRDETLALRGGLEHMAMAGEQGFDLAVVMLLADLLQTGRRAPFLADVWTGAARRLQHWPATLRAAAAHGLTRARDLGLVTLQTAPTAAERLTRQPEVIAEALLQIARAMRPDELFAVAQGGQGDAVDQHLTALHGLIRVRDGIFPTRDDRYPAEVVALTARVPGQPGHAGCTAILVLNVLQGGDRMHWMASQWQMQAAAYCGLKPSQRDPILAGFRHLYDTDPAFLDDAAGDFGPNGAGVTIPVVAEV